MKLAWVKKKFLFLFFLFFVASCAPTGIYHTVKPGQTLYRIALTYDIDEQRLADINNIKDPKQLKVNQRIFIPGVTRLRNVPLSEPTSKVSRTNQGKSDSPQQTKTSAAQSKQTQSSSSTAKIFFNWPVHGKVLNKFGSSGQRVVKGIEISAREGTEISAAAAGKVIYSGNGIPGYGNLVIIEHSGGFFSVYGYNKKNLVDRDDFVGQGDKIALSGAPPNGQSPRLHFEIRKGKSAVDPILYLP